MACRERRRRGTRCFTLELDEARLADFLVEAGVLTTIAADFPHLIGGVAGCCRLK